MVDYTKTQHISSLNAVSTTSGVIDGTDKMHSGLLKALELAAAGTAVLDYGSSVFRQVAGSARTQFSVTGAIKYMREGLVTSATPNAVELDADPDTSYNRYDMVVIQVSDGNFAIRRGTAAAIPRVKDFITAGDIPVALVEVVAGASSTANDATRKVQLFGFDKSTNSLSVGYNSSGYTESGSIVGASTGTTIASIADLTLDAADDIHLDAAGNSWRLYVGGSLKAYFEHSSGDIDFHNETQDKDITFSGNDGGSGVTALSLDMSNAGIATFNSSVRCKNDFSLTTDSSVFNMGAGSDFTITHDGTTGATIAGNPVNVTSAGAATFKTSAGNLTVDSEAGTSTLDGHTGVSVTASNSGDATISSAAAHVVIDAEQQIHLDSNGGMWKFLDNGVLQAYIQNNGGDINFHNEVADKVINFKGNDAGSGVTALSLNMAAAGYAAFNSGVTVGGDLLVLGGDISGPTDGSLTLKADTDMIFQIDSDADGSETFQFKNGAGTEIAQIDEAGNMQLDAALQVNQGNAAAITFAHNDGGITFNNGATITNPSTSSLLLTEATVNASGNVTAAGTVLAPDIHSTATTHKNPKAAVATAGVVGGPKQLGLEHIQFVYGVNNTAAHQYFWLPDASAAPGENLMITIKNIGKIDVFLLPYGFGTGSAQTIDATSNPVLLGAGAYPITLSSMTDGGGTQVSSCISIPGANIIQLPCMRAITLVATTDGTPSLPTLDSIAGGTCVATNYAQGGATWWILSTY